MCTWALCGSTSSPVSMPFPTGFLQLKVTLFSMSRRNLSQAAPQIPLPLPFPLLSLSNFYSSFLILLFFLLQGDKVSGNTWFDGYCLGCVGHHHPVAMEVAVPVCSYICCTHWALLILTKTNGGEVEQPLKLWKRCVKVSRRCALIAEQHCLRIMFCKLTSRPLWW